MTSAEGSRSSCTLVPAHAQQDLDLPMPEVGIKRKGRIEQILLSFILNSSLSPEKQSSPLPLVQTPCTILKQIALLFSLLLSRSFLASAQSWIYNRSTFVLSSCKTGHLHFSPSPPFPTRPRCNSHSSGLPESGKPRKGDIQPTVDR